MILSKRPDVRHDRKWQENEASDCQKVLMTIDQVWKEHLYAMDQLKDAIRFHGYAQKDPLMVYKNEGFKLFEGCLEKIATLTAFQCRDLHVPQDLRR